MQNDSRSADDGPTLAEALDIGQPVGSGSAAHDAILPRVEQAAADSAGSRRFTLQMRDPLAWISQCVMEETGRPIGLGATWVRLIDPIRGAGLIAVMHNPVTLAGGVEADLIVVANTGMLTRGTVVDLARWAFYGIGLHRLVVRVPADRPDLADLARRIGFRHEGAAYDALGPGLDAAVWSMTARSCRWLKQPPPAIPTADTSPPSSIRMH